MNEQHSARPTEERSVETVMCPHGYNRLVMEALGQHCAECEEVDTRYERIMRDWAVGRLAP